MTEQRGHRAIRAGFGDQRQRAGVKIARDEPGERIVGDELAHVGGIARIIESGHSFRISRIHAACSSIARRSEEHTSELQSLMRISYAVFFLTNKNYYKTN